MVLAEIVLNRILEIAIDKTETETEIKITVIKKYADDMFLLLPEQQMDRVCNIFNSINENVQFTKEIEEPHSIAFLDMRVIRNTASRDVNRVVSKTHRVGSIFEIQIDSPDETEASHSSGPNRSSVQTQQRGIPSKKPIENNRNIAEQRLPKRSNQHTDRKTPTAT